MAASMDDLLATMSSLPTGPQAQDLKDLHAALSSTLAQHRPSATRPTVPLAAARGPHNADPAPPPAPVSSFNDTSAPAPPPAHILSSGNWASGLGNSPRQVAPTVAAALAPNANNANTATNAAPLGAQFTTKRTTGFTPPPDQRPHHDAVLPTNASPVETPGFAHDAFRPLLDRERKGAWEGFAAR